MCLHIFGQHIGHHLGTLGMSRKDERTSVIHVLKIVVQRRKQVSLRFSLQKRVPLLGGCGCRDDHIYLPIVRSKYIGGSLIGFRLAFIAACRPFPQQFAVDVTDHRRAFRGIIIGGRINVERVYILRNLRYRQPVILICVI